MAREVMLKKGFATKILVIQAIQAIALIPFRQTSYVSAANTVTPP